MVNAEAQVAVGPRLGPAEGQCPEGGVCLSPPGAGVHFSELPEVPVILKPAFPFEFPRGMDYQGGVSQEICNSVGL